VSTAHVYALIALVALVGEFCLDRIADALNLRRLGGGVPREFTDVFDEDRYRKSQEYTRVNTRFGAVVAAFDLAVVLGFWFSGGFEALDEWVRGLNLAPIPTGLLYIGALVLARTLLSIPFSAVDTFVIEARFGFNRTTWKTFVLDRVKGFFLALVLGVPLLAGLLAFFEYAGHWAWLACWAAVTLFTLIIQFVAPAWILPLFNRFKPLEDGELKERILGYAGSVGYPLRGLYVVDGSRRSGKTNAYFTGFGRNRRIALFDTLIERHTIAELVAVLGHEIGHHRLKHVPKRMAMGIVHTGVLFFLLSFFMSRTALFEAFGVERVSVYAGFIFFGMLYAPIQMVLSVLEGMLSRRHEFQADRFAAGTGGDPAAMVSALKKLSADNLTNLTPHPFHVFLHASHPPVLERIRRLEP
jgi:STE24 endopeptidase